MQRDETFEETLARFDYDAPKELIATKGAEPRESARLLAFDRATERIELAHFADLPRFLGTETVLVFNETKVVPARLSGTTKHGGRVSLTVVAVRDGSFDALCSRRLSAGATVSARDASFAVSGRDGSVTRFKTTLSAANLRILLEKNGEAPLPPYIKHTPLSPTQAKERYQSIFARVEGSAAAPTASLHFSRALLDALAKAGVCVEFVTLHVGLGTFLPVTQRNFETETLHAETYVIDPETATRLNEARRAGKRIVPVGTTSLRALESAARDDGSLTRLSGETSLFIRAGYRFKIADGLITNFHVPRSSLLMLVDALLGGNERWRPLYERAVAERFRLFSFGDGMLIT